MSQCSTCQAYFADGFTFCPVDGKPLTRTTETEEQSLPVIPLAPDDYVPTILDDAGLARRAARTLLKLISKLDLDSQGYEDGLRDVAATVWFYIRCAIHLVLETLIIGLLLKLHHLVEEMFKNTPDSPCKFVLMFLFYILFAANVWRVLKFIYRHARR